jgi:hypothetical protein
MTHSSLITVNTWNTYKRNMQSYILKNVSYRSSPVQGPNVISRSKCLSNSKSSSEIVFTGEVVSVRKSCIFHYSCYFYRMNNLLELFTTFCVSTFVVSSLFTFFFFVELLANKSSNFLCRFVRFDI